MKKVKYSLYVVSIISLLGIVSCVEDEPTYPALSGLPVATLTADLTTIAEFDDPSTVVVEKNFATYTLTLDKPNRFDSKFKIEVLKDKSTGTSDDVIVNLPDSGIDNGSDGFLVIIPANSLSKTFTINANDDILPESTELVSFSLAPAVELGAKVATASQIFSLNITNSKSNNLFISFDWSGNYLDAAGVSHDAADYDMDLEVFNAAGAAIYDDYSGSPAKITFLSTEANGTYDIVANLWNGTIAFAPSLPINFKTTFTVSKPGVFVKTYKFDNQWNSATGPFAEPNSANKKSPIYFVKTGNIYQVYERSSGNLLISGRNANSGKIYSGRRK